MNKSIDELILDIACVCQYLEKAKKRSDFESRKLQAAVDGMKVNQPQGWSIFNTELSTDGPEKPIFAPENHLFSLGSCSSGA